jgi:hypothetical protein
MLSRLLVALILSALIAPVAHALGGSCKTSHCIALADTTPGIKYLTLASLPDVVPDAVHLH